jgi:hypothetical protein
MIGEMFLFEKFNISSLKTSLTEKQVASFTKRLTELLFKFNNNPAITMDYLVENLKITESSAKFSKNDNPSRPFIFIDIDFMLANTLIEVRISAEFNSACCRIPLTYYKYDIAIQKTEHSGLFTLLNMYKPGVGTNYFYFGSFRDDSVYTVTTKNAFKFQHYFVKTTRNRFHIEYVIKKNKIVSSQIIDDENDEYLKYDNKPLSAHDETLFIHFANAAYTKESEFVNSFVKGSVNFKDMKCFAQLKKMFLDIYTGEHRERLIDELLVFQMVDI